MRNTLVLFLTLTIGVTEAIAQEIEEIVVIGVVPAGASLQRDKIPFPVQAANVDDIERSNTLGIADFLNQNFASISLNDAQNNPLQPDLQYRGFTASLFWDWHRESRFIRTVFASTNHSVTQLIGIYYRSPQSRKSH